MTVTGLAVSYGNLNALIIKSIGHPGPILTRDPGGGIQGRWQT